MANAINQLTSMPKLPLTSGLMETKTPTPKGYVGAAEVGPALEELRGAEAKAEQDVGLADIKIEEAKRQEKATEAEKRMLRAEQFATELREMPERKTVEGIRKELGESAFVPTPETAKDLATMFTLMGVIGMVIGKNNAQLSMAAMNGMLEGHQKGRADLYKKEKDIFEKNFKALQQKLASAEKGLEEAIRLKTVDKEAGEQRIIMELMKTESPLLKAQYEKQGALAPLNSIKGARKDLETYTNLTNNLQKAADDRQARKDLKKYMADISAGRRDQKLLDSLGPALRNIAEQYPEGTAVSLVGASPDDKKRIQGAARAIEESEKVADFVARNPNAVGALAVAKNFLRVDAIKSLQSEDEGAVAAGKAAVIDQQLEEGVAKNQISRDDAEAAKVLQKKLFALALADVQGSGQRGSVYLDRQFQNLYDQASRGETLIKIIRERAEENNRNLKPYKLNIERHNNPEQFPLTETRNVEDYIKERKPKTGIPDNVEKALKGQPDGTGVPFNNKIYRIYGGVVREVKE